MAWIGGWLVALWALKRLSVQAARLSSVKSEKFVITAQTGSDRRLNQRVRRMSISLLLLVPSGGRWQKRLHLSQGFGWALIPKCLF